MPSGLIGDDKESLKERIETEKEAQLHQSSAILNNTNTQRPMEPKEVL